MTDPKPPRITPHRTRHIGSRSGEAVPGVKGAGPVTASTPDPVRPMVEVEGIGRNAGKPQRGPRNPATPLNDNARRVLTALQRNGDLWATAGYVADVAGVTTAQVGAALRELRTAGYAQSRRVPSSYTQWRAAP